MMLGARATSREKNTSVRKSSKKIQKKQRVRKNMALTFVRTSPQRTSPSRITVNYIKFLIVEFEIDKLVEALFY